MATEDQVGDGPFLTAQQTADYLHWSADTVRRMWAEGTLPAVIINGRRRTPKGALGRWIEAQDDKALAELKEQT